MYDSPHVFLDELPWDSRPRNTDWRYVRYELARLAEYEPELRFTQQRSLWVSVRGNLKALRAAVGWRAGFALSQQGHDTSKLAVRELRSSGANVVFAHRAYPMNAGSVPVVWMSAVVDPEMQRSYGVSAAGVQEQIDVKRPLFARAAAVQVATHAEARRHAAMFPESANKFVAVPFFTPHLEACSVELLERHKNASPVEILFVGNNALRKGLDVLLAAFADLPQALRERTKLTVISNFDRSPITVPADESIRVIRGSDNATVLAEMRRAHIFVNVARFETYGVVFPEAMSQGAVCLGPEWEVQREMFYEGRAGLNVTCEVSAVRGALERLIEDESFRYNLAVAARERFLQEYAPALVARRYAELFRGALRR